MRYCVNKINAKSFTVTFMSFIRSTYNAMLAVFLCVLRLSLWLKAPSYNYTSVSAEGWCISPHYH